MGRMSRSRPASSTMATVSHGAIAAVVTPQYTRINATRRSSSRPAAVAGGPRRPECEHSETDGPWSWLVAPVRSARDLANHGPPGQGGLLRRDLPEPSFGEERTHPARVRLA